MYKVFPNPELSISVLTKRLIVVNDGSACDAKHSKHNVLRQSNTSQLQTEQLLTSMCFITPSNLAKMEVSKRESKRNSMTRLVLTPKSTSFILLGCLSVDDLKITCRDFWGRSQWCYAFILLSEWGQRKSNKCYQKISFSYDQINICEKAVILCTKLKWICG